MSTLVDVIRAHLPRDRFDDLGEACGTLCSCGGWTGDYFADGEAGPFDEHLAAMVLAWVGERLRSDEMGETAWAAVVDVRDEHCRVVDDADSWDVSDAALAVVAASLGVADDTPAPQIAPQTPPAASCDQTDGPR